LTEGSQDVSGASLEIMCSGNSSEETGITAGNARVKRRSAPTRRTVQTEHRRILHVPLSEGGFKDVLPGDARLLATAL